MKNKKKQQKISPNYLEYIPKRKEEFRWHTDKNGFVTLDIENTGIFNRAAQKLFKKPRVSHIHLDKVGSFVWPLIDGEKNILALGKEVDAKFGEEAYPLYERLAKFFQILESYHFIELKK